MAKHKTPGGQKPGSNTSCFVKNTTREPRQKPIEEEHALQNGKAPASEKPSSNTTGSAKYNTGAQTEAFHERTCLGKNKVRALQEP